MKLSSWNQLLFCNLFIAKKDAYFLSSLFSHCTHLNLQVLASSLLLLSYFSLGSSCHLGLEHLFLALVNGSSSACHLCATSTMHPSKLVPLDRQGTSQLSWCSICRVAYALTFVSFYRSKQTGIQGGSHHTTSSYWGICIWIHYLISLAPGLLYSSLLYRVPNDFHCYTRFTYIFHDFSLCSVCSYVAL